MDQSKSLQSFLSGRVRILLGDITKQNVDVIVNAANIIAPFLAEGVSTVRSTLKEDHRFWKHAARYVARGIHMGCQLARLC